MPGKKILVVEDDALIRELDRVNLEAAGFEVALATDGFEGLEMARTVNPDLIVLDIMLPKMDGFKVCRILKFDDKFKHIPILMLTARIQEVDKETGFKTGADAYMTKPYEPEELIKKINQILVDQEKKPELK
ncbi:MAG: response regulator [bacterium]|nr:response regulator [bacterium]MDD5354233.1 response regulator [bacterium]MDD5757141.1 response regulator [bacterium]